jgi:hypothetical protein
MLFDGEINSLIMKTVYTSAIILSSLTACIDSNTNQNLTDVSATSESSIFKSQKNTPKIHAFVDGKTGLTVLEKSFPSHWDVISKPSYELDSYLPTFQYKIQNKEGLIGFNTNLRQFISFDDVSYGKMMKSYGQKNIKPFTNAESIVNQEINPAMQKIGFKLLKTYSDPTILAFMKKKIAEKGIGSNANVYIVVSEWTNNSGTKAMTLLAQLALKSTDMNSSGYTIWNYATDFLFVPEANFNTEKESFLKTVTNYKENPKWEEYVAFTRRERQLEADRQLKMQNDRANQQYAYFQQRMQDQKAQFESHQQMMKERYVSNDANHERFMNTLRGNSYSESNSADQNQRSFINMIREEQVVLNSDGQKYLVEAHSDRYWMNSNGEYIKTDDSFYNPNGDLNLNNQNWELIKKVDN